MKRRKRRSKCRCCKELFIPDYRNKKRQKFCLRPACRIAQKRDSQKRWLNKAQNRSVFKGAENVHRVQEWRKKHPGYWRKTAAQKMRYKIAVCQNSLEQKELCATYNGTTLQDYCLTEPSVLVGLISFLTGNTLQDSIAPFIQKLSNRGLLIMGSIPNEPLKTCLRATHRQKGDKDEKTKGVKSGSGTQSAIPI